MPSPHLTSEQSEFERRLAGTPVKVIRRGDDIILRMPSDVTFQVDRAEIQPAFYPVLDTMSETLVQYGETRVQVTGHADSTGADAYNQALSERRAASVGVYLNRKGVVRARLSMDGQGESAPIASNDTDEGRALNRRVEIVVQPFRPQPGSPLGMTPAAGF